MKLCSQDHRVGRGSVLVSQMEFLTFGATFVSVTFSRLACFSADTCSSGGGILAWGPTVAKQDEGRTPQRHTFSRQLREGQVPLSHRGSQSDYQNSYDELAA